VTILFQKLDEEFVTRQRERLAQQASLEGQASATAGATEEETMAEISFDDFMRLDLRVGVVRSAEPVAGADKLLKLQVDVGEAEPRQIVAGVAEWYEPATLVGRRIPVLLNLAPRKIRGEVSQGMLLAADEEGRAFLLSPDGEVAPGARIR
jgi:methionyl-tRNA synthetase